MSASFSVAAAAGSYTVAIERGSLARTVADLGARAGAGQGTTTVLFVDARFAPDFATLGLPILSVAAEETVKSLDAIPDLVIALRQFGANRRTHLVAVGGGIVQDTAAFIASVYMRGIDWTYVPTTLLGMADSCIGGKSSINVGPYKNIVGTYHAPGTILIDPDLTGTLGPEQRAAGLIEAAKICFCRGPESFAAYVAHAPGVDMAAAGFEAVVVESLAAKKWFIETDEFDRGERLLLNFGHTFGHALEGASHFAIAHGIAVGLGVLCAIEMGPALGRRYDDIPRVMQLRRHMRDLLAVVPGLKGLLGSLAVDAIIDRFGADKKHGPDFYSIVGLAADGAVELIKLPKTPDTLKAVAAALTAVIRTIET